MSKSTKNKLLHQYFCINYDQINNVTNSKFKINKKLKCFFLLLQIIEKKKIRDGSEKKLNTSHKLQFSNFYAT